ncbi:MAG TPA: M20 family metallopeptidase [bacterium]|jgi:acetylornithine deacetylase/succinyl-diaminopimelate desuccinylase-like protein
MSTQVDKVVKEMVSEDEIIELEKNLIRIPSYTLQEGQLAEFIRAFLSSAGIDAELQDVPIPEFIQSHNFPPRLTTHPGEAPAVGHNVVAVLPGSGQGPSLMFCGHMDSTGNTIDANGRVAEDFTGWKRDPHRPVVEDGRIYGKGAVDEKGGLSAMLSTAVAIKRAGLRPKGDIYFCPVMGHKTLNIGVKHLMKQGIRTTYGICTENAGNWIVPAHVGSVRAEVHVHGVNPTSMRYTLPETKDKASGFANAMRFVQTLGMEGVRHPDDGWLTFKRHPVLQEYPNHRVNYMNPKGLKHIVVGLLIKTVPGMTPETCKVDLERLLDRLKEQHPDFVASEVAVQQGVPPLDTPFTSPVVKALAAAYSTVTGDEARIGLEGRVGSFADSGVMAEAGIETCIFGPGYLHGAGVAPLRGEAPPDEWISVAELVDAARTMTLAAVDLSC